jgi:Flp pilus assembly protein TadD
MLQFGLALAPDHPGLLNTLAWYSAYYGDRQAAAKSAEKAAALRPWSAAMVDTHAAVLGAAGRCPEAAARERQALDLAVHASAGQRAAYLGKLKAYETTCTRQTPTPLGQ